MINYGWEQPSLFEYMKEDYVYPQNYGKGAMMAEYQSVREQLLNGAVKAVTQQRNNQYGPPTQDFDRVAKAATTYGFSFNDEPLQPHHVAFFQMLVKLSRITWSHDHEDSWMDIAGYAACGYECSKEEDNS